MGFFLWLLVVAGVLQLVCWMTELNDHSWRAGLRTPELLDREVFDRIRGDQ